MGFDCYGLGGWNISMNSLLVQGMYRKVSDNGIDKLTVTIPKVEPPPPLKAQKHPDTKSQTQL